MEQRHLHMEPVSPAFTANVASLAFMESAALDPDPMLDLFTKLGEEGAERAITHTLHSIARDLEQVRLCNRQQDWETARSALKGLARTARQIGLVSVSQVAEDVLLCQEEQNKAGLAATAARLIRLGDQALSELWNAPENLF